MSADESIAHILGAACEIVHAARPFNESAPICAPRAAPRTAARPVAPPMLERAPTRFLTALIGALANGAGIKCTHKGLLVHDMAAFAQALADAGLSTKYTTISRQMASYGFVHQRSSQGDPLWAHASASTLPPASQDELWQRYSPLAYARRARPRGLRAQTRPHRARATETLIAQLRLLFDQHGAMCTAPGSIRFARPEDVSALLARHKLPSNFQTMCRSMRQHGFRRERGSTRTMHHVALAFADLNELMRLTAYYTTRAHIPRVRAPA